MASSVRLHPRSLSSSFLCLCFFSLSSFTLFLLPFFLLFFRPFWFSLSLLFGLFFLSLTRETLLCLFLSLPLFLFLPPSLTESHYIIQREGIQGIALISQDAFVKFNESTA